LNKIRH